MSVPNSRSLLWPWAHRPPMVKHYNHQVSLHIEKSSFFLSQSDKSPFQNTPPTRLSVTYKSFSIFFEIVRNLFENSRFLIFCVGLNFSSLWNRVLCSRWFFIDEKAYLKLLFSNKFSFNFYGFRPLLWYEGELIASFHQILIFIWYWCPLSHQVVKQAKLREA